MAALAIGILALLILTGMGIGMLGDDAVAAQSGARLVPIYSVARDDKAVAITVDATWGADFTPQLLDLFDQHAVKVTFFLAGHWITDYPDMVKEIAARGHEVGNHSWTHPNMGSLPVERIREELERTQRAIADLIGVAPKVFRPPFGDYSNTLITEAGRMGLQTIQWSIDSLDWKNPTTAEIVERVMSRMKPGAIVLFHNAAQNTPAALAQIIPRLKAEGYSLVTVSELLLKGDTYINRNTGEQRPAAPKPAAPESQPAGDSEEQARTEDDESGRRPQDEPETRPLVSFQDQAEIGGEHVLVVSVRNRRLALALVALGLMVLTAAVVVASPSARRRVLGVRRGVTLAGQDLGGLYPDEVRRVVLSLSSQIERHPRDAMYHSETGEIIPEELGVALDVDGTVEAVMSAPKGAQVELSLREVPPKVTAAMLKPVHGVTTSTPAVSLVFNVAWGEEYLPDILSALREAGAKCTFFLTGTWVRQYPNLVSAIHEDGHELANHGWSHAHPKAMSDSGLERLIGDNEALIRELTGVRTVLFAPPYGEVDQRIASVAARMGYTTIMWTVDTIDWQLPSPEVVTERALSKLAPGNIILMHPTDPTAKALRSILEQLRSQGYSMVTVSELLKIGKARHS